jgi:exosortase
VESVDLTTAAIAAVVVLLLLEWLSPWRRAAPQTQYRWLTNIGLMLLGGLVVGAIFPFSADSVAADLRSGWFNDAALPPVAEALLVFLLLDFWRYWEHRVYHEAPLMWRVHLVHHSDTALDITTAERHHPIEAIIAAGTLLLLVFALGFSAEALAVYVTVATLSAWVSHANIALPESIDRALRTCLVTPAVHAIHHSEQQPQTDSNYGSVLTIWDRWFGTYTDPAGSPVARFGLTYFHRPVDSALAPALMQPFEYRRGMAYPERLEPEAAVQPGASISEAWKQTLLQLAVAIGLVVIALWPTIQDLTNTWSSAEPYQYAWLVLPMFLYTIAVYHRERILAMTPQPGALGLAVIALALVLWTVAYVVDINLGQHLALVLVLQGVFLSALGWTVYRRLFPVMAMLFLLVPAGDLLQPMLRGLTVNFVEWFALLFDLPLRIDGFVTYIGDHRYVVVDACSGLTFVTLGGFLAYSFGVLVFRSFAKVLALAVLGAALGVLTNAIRVWLILGVDHLQGSQMEMAAHTDLQWLALLIGIGLLFFVTLRLSPSGGWSSRMTEKKTAVRRRVVRFAPSVAGVMVLSVVFPVQSLGTGYAKVAALDSLALFADRQPGSSWMNARDTADERVLVVPITSDVEMLVSEKQGIHGRVDESRLYPGEKQGWRHTATRHYRACEKQACFDFVHLEWRRRDSDEERHALYLYYVDTMFTDSKFTYRVASGWRGLVEPMASSGLLGFRANVLPSPALLVAQTQRFRAMLDSAGEDAGNTPLAAASYTQVTR